MANIPLCALTDIWNNSGVNYNGINLSITNTASNTGSRMMYIYTSGVDGGSFEITKAGCINKITVGLGAGNVLTNTAIGQYALGSNIVAGNNTAIGQNTLTNNTVGDRNTAVGTCSLANNLSGSYSTSIGNDALLSSYGDQNLAVGYRSGRSITTGNYNVILGSFEADAPYDTQSNNVFIADGAGNLRMYINSSGILTVGAYTTNNGILKTNASGTLSYSTITDDGTTVTINTALTVTSSVVGIAKANATGNIAYVRSLGGTNNPGIFFNAVESTGISTIDFSGTTGFIGMLALGTVPQWEIANHNLIGQTASTISTSSGALTLAPASGLVSVTGHLRTTADVNVYGPNSGSAANRIAMTMEGSGAGRILVNGTDVSTYGTFKIDIANASGTLLSPTPFFVSAAGNVGIGTTSPTRPLSIKADSNGYNIGLNDSGDTERSWIYSISTGSVWQTAASMKLQLNGSNGTGLIVDNASNVGIGIAAPGHKLNVYGTGNTAIEVQGNGTASLGYLSARADGDPVIQMGQFGSAAAGTTFGIANTRLSVIYTTTYATTQPLGMAIGNNTAIPIYFATNQVVRFTIDGSSSTLTGNGASTIATSSGNLIFQPVGVSSFGTDAQLNGNSVLWNEAGVRSWTMGTASSTGTLTLQSGDAAGVFRVYTASLYANGVLQVGGTGDSYILGNVGIGTASPGAKLDVQGNIYALTGTSGQGIFLRGPALTTVTSQPSLTLSNAWGGNADGLRVNAYSGIGLYANDTLGLFVAGTNSGYTVGNVGIGTTAPSTLLHVYRNAAGSSVNITGGAVGSRNDTGIDFSIINATSVVYGRIAQQVTTASIGAEVGGLVFSTINSGTLAERMFIQGDGKVGIGTTSPGRLLEVGVTGAAGVVGIARFSHSVGGNQRSWDIGVGEAASFGANDNFGIKDSSGGNTVLVIDTSGNVGIDTTLHRLTKLSIQ
jgi:hypothetical protein